MSLEEMSYEENITSDESLGSSPGEYNKFRDQQASEVEGKEMSGISKVKREHVCQRLLRDHVK